LERDFSHLEDEIQERLEMKSHWLLLLCLLFVAAPLFAQEPPRALVGDLDGQTGQVTLNWQVPNGEADWLEGFEDGVADGFTYDNAANWSTAASFMTGTNTPYLSGQTWTSASYGTETFGDGIFEANFSRTAGTDTWTQLLTVHGDSPYSDTYSGFFFGIAPSVALGGAIYVARIDAGVFTAYNAWGAAEMNLGVGATNTVSVVADAGNYSMFVNGAEVFAFTDLLYASGQVGCGFSEDNLIEVTGSVTWDYLSADDGVAAVTSMTPATVGFEGHVEDLAHMPAGFNARRPQTKTMPNGLIYVDGEYQGMQTDELDDFIEFNVYANGALAATTTNTSYAFNLPAFGAYAFTVTAFYDEGESDEIGPLNFTWTDPSLIALSEDFDDGLPETWTIETSIATASWKHSSADTYNRNFFPTPYMLIDSDADGEGPWMQARLITPEIDITGSNFTQLSYDFFYENIGTDFMTVDLSTDGGATWINVANYVADFSTATETYDVTAALEGFDAAWFSWYYDDDDVWAWYGAVDNVEVYAETEADDVTLNLTPQVTNIPAGGGTIVYDVQVVSLIGASMASLRYWTYATLPNQQVFGPMVTLNWNLTPFMNVTVTGMTQDVPANAPAGDFLFTAFAGVQGNPNLQIQDSFGFTKAGVATDGDFEFNPEDWKATGSFEIAGEDVALEIPAEFALQQAYPNPFNPTTTVAVSLPEAADLSVTVFNVMGQQVATLTSGKLVAGTHNFVFDASHLSSGLYFVQAQVPGKLNQIQKVTLMK
jgi:Secretion system C-terminal sorting domain